jgi:hypothetical protein
MKFLCTCFVKLYILIINKWVQQECGLVNGFQWRSFNCAPYYVNNTKVVSSFDKFHFRQTWWVDVTNATHNYMLHTIYKWTTHWNLEFKVLVLGFEIKV